MDEGHRGRMRHIDPDAELERLVAARAKVGSKNTERPRYQTGYKVRMEAVDVTGHHVMDSFDIETVLDFPTTYRGVAIPKTDDGTLPISAPPVGPYISFSLLGHENLWAMEFDTLPAYGADVAAHLVAIALDETHHGGPYIREWPGKWAATLLWPMVSFSCDFITVPHAEDR